MTTLEFRHQNFPVSAPQRLSRRRARFSEWELVEGIDWDDPNLVPVAEYQRISHDQKQDAHGVRDQGRDNATTASRLGWTIVARFTDNDITASKADVERPAFKLLTKCLKKGELPNGQPFRGVVVQDEDRLVKRNDEFEAFIEALTYDDGRVFADLHGAKDYYSEDVEGLGHIGIVFRVMETRKKQRRLRANHRNRALRGKTVGRRTFGWSADDKDRLDNTEAAIGRVAIREFLSGRSYNSIVSGWNRDGVKTTTGGPWTSSGLRQWLQNPRLCGWRKLNDDEIVRDENGNPIIGQWEALIDPDVWQAVQARIDAFRGKRVDREQNIHGDYGPDHGARKYVFSGYLWCGRTDEQDHLCHARIKGGPSAKGNGYRYYCPSPSDGGCGGISRSGRYVDQFLGQALLARIEKLDAAQETVSEWDPKELEAMVQQRNELTDAWGRREITGELYWPQIKRIEREIKTLRAAEAQELLRLKQRVKNLEEVRVRWELPEDEGGYDLGQRRAIIDNYIYAVTIHPSSRRGPGFDPDALEIHWR